jgi:hypothetical protein
LGSVLGRRFLRVGEPPFLGRESAHVCRAQTGAGVHSAVRGRSHRLTEYRASTGEIGTTASLSRASASERLAVL